VCWAAATSPLSSICTTLKRLVINIQWYPYSRSENHLSSAHNSEEGQIEGYCTIITLKMARPVLWGVALAGMLK
jgi:hypothetical protein